MKINFLLVEKEKIEVEIDNLTIAELLRDMLWEQEGVILAVWKRDHPSKNPIIVLETKGKDAKKILISTIEQIQELNSEMISQIKKLKWNEVLDVGRKNDRCDGNGKESEWREKRERENNEEWLLNKKISHYFESLKSP